MRYTDQEVYSASRRFDELKEALDLDINKAESIYDLHLIGCEAIKKQPDVEKLEKLVANARGENALVVSTTTQQENQRYGIYEWRISEIGRESNVSYGDVYHAVQTAWLRQPGPGPSDFTALIGPGRDGRLVHIVFLGYKSDDPVVMYAMGVSRRHEKPLQDFPKRVVRQRQERSWHEIALALGVTWPAARRRFGNEQNGISTQDLLRQSAVLREQVAWLLANGDRRPLEDIVETVYEAINRKVR